MYTYTTFYNQIPYSRPDKGIDYNYNICIQYKLFTCWYKLGVLGEKLLGALWEMWDQVLFKVVTHTISISASWFWHSAFNLSVGEPPQTQKLILDLWSSSWQTGQKATWKHLPDINAESRGCRYGCRRVVDMGSYCQKEDDCGNITVCLKVQERSIRLRSHQINAAL